MVYHASARREFCDLPTFSLMKCCSAHLVLEAEAEPSTSNMMIHIPELHHITTYMLSALSGTQMEHICLAHPPATSGTDDSTTLLPIQLAVRPC